MAEGENYFTNPKLCRYIEGDLKKETAVYCQREHKPGSAYCPGHHALCSIPVKPLKDLAYD